MKRLLIISCLLITTLCFAGGLYPPSFTNTWAGSDIPQYLDTNTWLSFTTYTLTNNLILASDNMSTQDLTGLDIQVRVGDPTTNVLYHGTTTNGPSGIFSCNFTIPTSTPGSVRIANTYIQLALTNSVGTVVTFKGYRILSYINPLH